MTECKLKKKLEDILTKIFGKVCYNKWYEILHTYVMDEGVGNLSGFGDYTFREWMNEGRIGKKGSEGGQ